MLLVKDDLLSNITSVHVHDVACGIGNVVHNKGGIGVWVGIDVGGEVRTERPQTYPLQKFL